MTDRLVLSIKEAALALNLSPRTVAALCARGDLPVVKIGRRVLLPTHLLRAWLERRAGEVS